MNSYTIKSYTVSQEYYEDISLNDALSLFADLLFKEGFININTLYDKESGKIYRKLSIDVSKNEYK